MSLASPTPSPLLFAGTVSLSSSSDDDGIAPWLLLLLGAGGSAWLLDWEDEGGGALFMSWGGSWVSHLDRGIGIVRHSVLWLGVRKERPGEFKTKLLFVS